MGIFLGVSLVMFLALVIVVVCVCAKRLKKMHSKLPH